MPMRRPTPGLGIAVLLAFPSGCARPPGVRLCEAIARRDVAGVRAVLAEGEIDASIDQGGCVPVEAVFGAVGPKEGALTAIGIELLKAGLSPQASWPSRTGGARVFAVVEAAARGNLELVRALMAVGLDLQSPEAGRALIRAAEAGHLPVVTLLVDEGVNPEVADGDATALGRAAANQHAGVVHFLETTVAARRAAGEPR